MTGPTRGCLALLLVVAAGCGGGAPDSGGGRQAAVIDPARPWTGTWTAVSENGAPAAGQLLLTPTSFSQARVVPEGPCVRAGTVTGATATRFTVTTLTASGAAQCAQAIGGSATAAWAVSNDNNTLTLDYGPPPGPVQVWTRTTDGMSDK